MPGRSHLPNSPTLEVPIGTRGSAGAEGAPQEEGHKGLRPPLSPLRRTSLASAFGHLTFRSAGGGGWAGWSGAEVCRHRGRRERGRWEPGG